MINSIDEEALFVKERLWRCCPLLDMELEFMSGLLIMFSSVIWLYGDHGIMHLYREVKTKYVIVYLRGSLTW